jgi:predicted nucleic acid binding AN1-type Zn finger protein
MECEYCGKKEAYGFTCHYCGKRCCSDHKIPEMHNCPYVSLVGKPENSRHITKKSPVERVNDAIFWMDKDKRVKKD